MTRSFLPALAALALFSSVAYAHPDDIELPPDATGTIYVDGARVDARAAHVAATASPALTRTRGLRGALNELTEQQGLPKGSAGKKPDQGTGAKPDGTCDSNKPCAPGFECRDGVCVPTTTTPSTGTCDSSKPCAPGFECRDGVCVPTTSSGTAGESCAPGYRRVGGVCVPDAPLGDTRDLDRPTTPIRPNTPPVAPRNDDPRAHSYQQALQRAQAEGKVVLVDFYADWCGPCKRLLRESLPSLLADAWVRENAIVVKVNIDHEPGLKRQFGVTGIPDLRVLRVGQDGQVSAGESVKGFVSAGQLRGMLQRAR
jgi:thiol-disulfide isomerase/thioredoxin